MSKDKMYKFKCFEIRQGKHSLYCFIADAATVWSFVQINKREPDKNKGYQRTLSPSRVKMIKRYIEGGNPIPNSLLVALNSNSSYNHENGLLSVPKIEDAGWIIDGQHRLAGAHESSENIELVVVAFIGIELKEQINQFVTINKEAKNVPSSLYLDLLPQLNRFKRPNIIAQERARDIAIALNSDPDSPFYNRITITSPKKGELSLTNFVRKSYTLVFEDKGIFGAFYLEEQIKIFNNYFVALENNFPEHCRHPKMTFFKTLGFGALMNALPIIFGLTARKHNSFRPKDIASVLKQIDYFDFDSWNTMGSGSAAEKQAGEDLIEELRDTAREEGEDMSAIAL